MSVAAILLAAGRGTRFGATPKVLADLGGAPLIRHVAEAACGSALAPILVVIGECEAGIGDALAGLPVRLVANPCFADGLSTSLRAGWTALPPDATGAAILLGDMPGISAVLLDAIVTAWEAAGRPAALVPTYEGRRGNPVLLSRTLAAEIAALRGDAGAGRMLRDRADVVLWKCDDPAILTDVDTPADLVQAALPRTTPPRMAE